MRGKEAAVIETQTVTERHIDAPGVRFMLRTTGSGLYLQLEAKYSTGPGFKLVGSQLRALYRLLEAGRQERGS